MSVQKFFQVAFRLFLSGSILGSSFPLQAQPLRREGLPASHVLSPNSYQNANNESFEQVASRYQLQRDFDIEPLKDVDQAAERLHEAFEGIGVHNPLDPLGLLTNFGVATKFLQRDQERKKVRAENHREVVEREVGFLLAVFHRDYDQFRRLMVVESFDKSSDVHHKVETDLLEEAGQVLGLPSVTSPEQALFILEAAKENSKVAEALGIQEEDVVDFLDSNLGLNRYFNLQALTVEIVRATEDIVIEEIEPAAFVDHKDPFSALEDRLSHKMKIGDFVGSTEPNKSFRLFTANGFDPDAEFLMQIKNSKGEVVHVFRENVRAAGIFGKFLVYVEDSVSPAGVSSQSFLRFVDLEHHRTAIGNSGASLPRYTVPLPKAANTASGIEQFEILNGELVVNGQRIQYGALETLGRVYNLFSNAYVSIFSPQTQETAATLSEEIAKYFSLLFTEGDDMAAQALQSSGLTAAEMESMFQQLVQSLPASHDVSKIDTQKLLKTLQEHKDPAVYANPAVQKAQQVVDVKERALRSNRLKQVNRRLWARLIALKAHMMQPQKAGTASVIQAMATVAEGYRKGSKETRDLGVDQFKRHPLGKYSIYGAKAMAAAALGQLVGTSLPEAYAFDLLQGLEVPAAIYHSFVGFLDRTAFLTNYVRLFGEGYATVGGAPLGFYDAFIGDGRWWKSVIAIGSGMMIPAGAFLLLHSIVSGSQYQGATNVAKKSVVSRQVDQVLKGYLHELRAEMEAKQKELNESQMSQSHAGDRDVAEIAGLSKQVEALQTEIDRNQRALAPEPGFWSYIKTMPRRQVLKFRAYMSLKKGVADAVWVDSEKRRMRVDAPLSREADALARAYFDAQDREDQIAKDLRAQAKEARRAKWSLKRLAFWKTHKETSTAMALMEQELENTEILSGSGEGEEKSLGAQQVNQAHTHIGNRLASEEHIKKHWRPSLKSLMFWKKTDKGDPTTEPAHFLNYKEALSQFFFGFSSHVATRFVLGTTWNMLFIVRSFWLAPSTWYMAVFYPRFFGKALNSPRTTSIHTPTDWNGGLDGFFTTYGKYFARILKKQGFQDLDQFETDIIPYEELAQKVALKKAAHALAKHTNDPSVLEVLLDTTKLNAKGFVPAEQILDGVAGVQPSIGIRKTTDRKIRDLTLQERTFFRAYYESIFDQIMHELLSQKLERVEAQEKVQVSRRREGIATQAQDLALIGAPEVELPLEDLKAPLPPEADFRSLSVGSLKKLAAVKKVLRTQSALDGVAWNDALNATSVADVTNAAARFQVERDRARREGLKLPKEETERITKWMKEMGDHPEVVSQALRQATDLSEKPWVASMEKRRLNFRHYLLSSLDPENNNQMGRYSNGLKGLGDFTAMLRATRAENTSLFVEKPILFVVGMLLYAGIQDGSIFQPIHDEMFSSNSFLFGSRALILNEFTIGILIGIMADSWMKVQENFRIEQMGGFSQSPLMSDQRRSHLRYFFKSVYKNPQNKYLDQHLYRLGLVWSNMTAAFVTILIGDLISYGRFDLGLYLAGYLYVYLMPTMGMSAKLEQGFELSTTMIDARVPQALRLSKEARERGNKVKMRRRVQYSLGENAYGLALAPLGIASVMGTEQFGQRSLLNLTFGAQPEEIVSGALQKTARLFEGTPLEQGVRNFAMACEAFLTHGNTALDPSKLMQNPIPSQR